VFEPPIAPSTGIELMHDKRRGQRNVALLLRRLSLRGGDRYPRSHALEVRVGSEGLRSV
jgi:hypothetical protein